MAPETKEVFDYVVTLLGPAGLGAIILAWLGIRKAKAEKPHIAPPTTGAAALTQIGGMVLGQQVGQDLIDRLGQLAASHDRCTLAREAEMLARRKIWEERQAHEKRLAEDRHDDARDVVDQLKTLNDRLRDARVG